MGTGNIQQVLLLALLSLVPITVKCAALDDNYMYKPTASNGTVDDVFIITTADIGLNISASQTFKIFMTDKTTIHINYTALCVNNDETYLVSVHSNAEDVTSVEGSIFELYCTDMAPNETETDFAMDVVDGDRRPGVLQVKIEGIMIGMAKLELTSCLADRTNLSKCDGPSVTQHVSVIVLRKIGLFDIIFRSIITVMIVIITMAFGAKLDLGVVRHSFRSPIALLIGFVCQYVLMPLVCTYAPIYTTGYNFNISFLFQIYMLISRVNVAVSPIYLKYWSDSFRFKTHFC